MPTKGSLIQYRMFGQSWQIQCSYVNQHVHIFRISIKTPLVGSTSRERENPYVSEVKDTVLSGKGSADSRLVKDQQRDINFGKGSIDSYFVKG